MMHNKFLKLFSFLSKNRRLRIVTEEEYEFANKKRLEHKAKLDSRKNKLNFIYNVISTLKEMQKNSTKFYQTLEKTKTIRC